MDKGQVFFGCFQPVIIGLASSLRRYAFNEEEGELPEWFAQEEKQHRIRQLPVDKKEVEHYRKRWREINARPIKKVAEAKARKKRRVSG